MSFSMQHSSTMTQERTPKTPRSIVRNHSPYCESTGPIVQEGFVAARVRALQGFSDQAQTLHRSHTPITPCPRPSIGLKSVLVGTKKPNIGSIDPFHNQFLAKEHRTLLSAPGGSASFADVALIFQRQEQQPSLRPAMSSKSDIKDRGTETPTTLFEDNVASSHAQRNHVKAPRTPYESVSKIDQADNVPAENSSPAEISIFSPHAIQADLVEPRATWGCLPQTEDRNNDCIHEQDLKPRGSIADKLGSMVEWGWVGGDRLGILDYEDGFASHSTEPKNQIRDPRLNSESAPYETPRLKKVASSSDSSASTAEIRTEMQHSTGQATPPHSKHKEPEAFVYCGPQKGRKRQAKRSSAVQTPQRSSSDFGVRHRETELASPRGMRRARTMQYLGHSTSIHSQLQSEAPPSIWSSHAWDYRSSGLDHYPTKSPPSRECSIIESGFDLTMLRDEQLDPDAPALSKDTSTRCSTSETKESARSTSRSTSFFRRFPWYKVALIDKQPVIHSLSKGDCGNRTSRTARVVQHDPPFNQIELSQHVSKSYTPTECPRGEGTNSPNMRIPPHQDPIDQQAVDVKTLYCKASSQPTIELVKSQNEMNEQQPPESIQTALERPQDSYAASLTIGDERLSKSPHLIVKDVIGHKQGSKMTRPPGTQPRDPSQSGTMDANFESLRQGDVQQSLQSQGPKMKQHSQTQSYTFSHRKPTKRRADTRTETGSSSSEVTRPEKGFSAGASLDLQPRSEVVNFAPKCVGNGTGSLPTSVHESEEDGPPRRGVQGRGKGIKKIQVTVTFDGAEDLVVDAMLRKRYRREH